MKGLTHVLSFGALALATAATAAGCDGLGGRREAALPPTDSLEAVYARNGMRGQVSLDGGTVEFLATQDPDQLRRGGTLWARVGPYIYLFTPATREVLDRWESIGAVRVITQTPSGEEVARATLRSGRLTDVRWRRSLNLLGRALQEGTERPRRLEELVRWGEENTEHQYNPAYVPRT